MAEPGNGRPRRVAIVQSSYIPWKGTFDMMRRVDELILLDDVQFTRRDWRNRNRIKTRDGLKWLTIPVEAKGNFERAIKDIRVSDGGWPERHWESLRHAYSKAPWFAEYGPRIEEVYRAASDELLSQVNFRFLCAVRDLLGIRTEVTWSMDYASRGRKTERLVSLCSSAGATEYLSGPTARAYLDESAFAAVGVAVLWMDYDGYPEYEQLHPPFEHRVTILDLLFHTGPHALAHMLPDEAR